MKFYDQRLLGDFNSPPAERGDCDRSCLASFIGCDPECIPHFYASEEGNPERMIHDWLMNKGFIRVGMKIAAPGVCVWSVPVGPCIVVGKSPRGNCLHAVVGRIINNESFDWELVHDPHPSRGGIAGWPVMFEFVFRVITK